MSDMRMFEQHQAHAGYWEKIREKLVGPNHGNRPLLFAVPTSAPDESGDSDVGQCVKCNQDIWVPQNTKIFSVPIIKACKSCYSKLSEELGV